jgi:hypothetical protein
MALRAAKGDEDALACRSARAHACRVGTPADMFLDRVFNGAVAGAGIHVVISAADHWSVMC